MTNSIERIVVIGGGLAGAKTVQALRDQSYAGQLSLVCAENELPYERPPLSKDYLMGNKPFADALVHDEQWYADNAVDLRRAVRATSIDRVTSSVQLADGTALAYDRLVLATGSTPRALPIGGADAANVLTLRSRTDSDAIRASFGEGRNLVLIGAGWIGLEVAAAARAAGTSVTVIEAAAQPLLAVLGDELAPVFADLHRAHGVDLRLDASLDRITVEQGRATGVVLADGTQLAADAIVVGVGASPNVELAEQCGLDVDNGVLVDPFLRSSDPAVFAVGDIANHDHPVLGRRIRVEHWAAALNQPAAAARAILGGGEPYEALPYFFSDQYDLGLEYLGYSERGDRVIVRGDVAAREFVAFWLSGDERLTAVMNVNVWDVPDAVRPFIRDRTPVDPGKLADPTVELTAIGRD